MLQIHENYLTKQEIVHAACSVLPLLAVPHRLDVELKKDTLTAIRLALALHLNSLCSCFLMCTWTYWCVLWSLIPSTNHSTAKLITAETVTLFVQLEILEKIKCRHIPYPKDMSPLVPCVFSQRGFQEWKIFLLYPLLCLPLWYEVNEASQWKWVKSKLFLPTHKLN